ncbi:MAG: hypothetical protein M5R36_06215 [Deltaproteobacteria bacterium]|nr:hypothetical protein [Deltaproteobacteria bacterium]
MARIVRHARDDLGTTGPSPMVEELFRELMELGLFKLEPEEAIVAGCGRKGEMEEVLLVTDRRVFYLTRRAGAMIYAVQEFEIGSLRPVPSSAGMLGAKIILADGRKTAVMDSPGGDGYLDDAHGVIRELNKRILQVQQSSWEAE